MEDTVHYALDTPLGRAEWRARLPAGDGLLRLGPSGRVFTLGLFHELRCLDTIRFALDDIFSHPERATPDEDSQPPLVKHCMDYLRQMVLCHADLTLLNIKSVLGQAHSQTSDITHTCKDFSAVFAAAEENYNMYH
jgi:hypothetical protein